MTDAAKLDYAKSYLRRTQTLAELKALAATVAAAVLNGQTRIAVTGIAIEGGNTQGQLEFECAIVGAACEALIAEQDATVPVVYRQLGSAVVFR